MAQNPNRINRISIQIVNMTDPHATMKRLPPILVPMMRRQYFDGPRRNASSTPPVPKLLRDEQRTQGISLRTRPAPRGNPNRSLCRPRERQSRCCQVNPRHNRIADDKEFAIRGLRSVRRAMHPKPKKVDATAIEQGLETWAPSHRLQPPTLRRRTVDSGTT